MVHIAWLLDSRGLVWYFLHNAQSRLRPAMKGFETNKVLVFAAPYCPFQARNVQTVKES